MPPRKRARVSQAASPTTTSASQVKTPTPAQSPAEKEREQKRDEQLVDDPWTDEEEIGLFKGLMRFKPTGIHKHFQLISLHQFLLDNGYIHPKNEHTKPAGIWLKLRTLYNLEALDEREDARQLDKVETKRADNDDETSSSADEDASKYSVAANKIDNGEFELPEEHFGQDKWERRLEDSRQQRNSSPVLMEELNLDQERPVRFTPSFSVEPSETATPVKTRGRPRGSTVGTKAKAAVASTAGKRRSTRQAESVADEEEEQEEDGEDNEDEDDEASQDASEDSTPVPRSTRSRGNDRKQTVSRSVRKRGRGRGR